MDVVELQRVALEESKAEDERTRQAYQEALQELSSKAAHKASGGTLRPKLLLAHDRLLDTLALLAGNEPDRPHSEAKELIREALEAVTDAEIATENGVMLDKIVRQMRVRRAAEADLEPPLHVDHHADKEGRDAPVREVRRQEMRRPSTSQAISVPELRPVSDPGGKRGEAMPTQPRGMTPPAIMSNPSALFKKPEEIEREYRTPTPLGGGTTKLRGKGRGVMAVTRMMPLRSVNDWVNTATKHPKKGITSAKELREAAEAGKELVVEQNMGLDPRSLQAGKRPLPPITPEIEPPVTPE